MRQPKFLSLGLESVEDDSEHHRVGMADETEGTIVLTLHENRHEQILLHVNLSINQSVS